MSVFSGILFHGVGAGCASLCYTPQEKTKAWSWQTFWLAQASVCWLILPFVGAWLTIPNLKEILSEAPQSAMYGTFLYGAAYGIGGTAFGLAIRYVGFSLTYAISVGMSAVLGTLVPPLFHGQLGAILSKPGSEWIIIGIILGAVGIAATGFAGRFKEKDIEEKERKSGDFQLGKGLFLCLIAGVLSAVYGFGIDQGQPLADLAAKYGAGHFQTNVIYIFLNTGAFLTTAVYCIYLHVKEKTFAEYNTPAEKDDNTTSKRYLYINYLLASLTGLLWYSQFFFYGLGHTRMGTFKFTSWGIHMIMLVLFSSIVGLILKEWSSVKLKTKYALALAIAILIASVLVLTYGSYLGN